MSQPVQPDAEFRKVLNKQHGYGFQYAVIKRAQDLFEQQQSPWFFEVAEFPVVAGGETTHVDFILRQIRRQNFYLVGECKRTNPDFSRWCFARAPYSVRNQQIAGGRRIILESCSCEPPHDVTHAITRNSSNELRVFDIGLELRKPNNSKEKPTDTKDAGSQSSGRSAIMGAVTQVLRGTSGLINHFFGAVMPRSQLAGNTLTFLPVIFTTADLWVTDADLSAADLTSGELKEVNSSVTDWIWFNHNRSTKLRHDLDFNLAGDISSELESEFTRSVAIVSPVGVDSFLSQTLEYLLW